MKHPLIAAGLAFILGAFYAPTTAEAGNSSVETVLETHGDLSKFHQALINTGVLDQMNEQTSYTIFAPTNAAFAQMSPRDYPCFYSAQCRPEIAVLLRNHIILGRHDLKDLTTYGQGIVTAGNRRIHIEEPFLGAYKVEGNRILSQTEVNGNIIYRTDGVISLPQELARFEVLRVIPASAGTTVTTEKTVTRKTYPARLLAPAPAASDDTQETTTVIHTYTTE